MDIGTFGAHLLPFLTGLPSTGGGVYSSSGLPPSPLPRTKEAMPPPPDAPHSGCAAGGAAASAAPARVCATRPPLMGAEDGLSRIGAASAAVRAPPPDSEGCGAAYACWPPYCCRCEAARTAAAGRFERSGLPATFNSAPRAAVGEPAAEPPATESLEFSFSSSAMRSRSCLASASAWARKRQTARSPLRALESRHASNAASHRRGAAHAPASSQPRAWQPRLLRSPTTRLATPGVVRLCSWQPTRRPPSPSPGRRPRSRPRRARGPASLCGERRRGERGALTVISRVSVC